MLWPWGKNKSFLITKKPEKKFKNLLKIYHTVYLSRISMSWMRIHISRSCIQIRSYNDKTTDPTNKDQLNLNRRFSLLLMFYLRDSRQHKRWMNGVSLLTPIVIHLNPRLAKKSKFLFKQLNLLKLTSQILWMPYKSITHLFKTLPMISN